MNSEVVVDPKELREFARQIKDMALTSNQAIDGLLAALHRLGATWTDQQYSDFVRHVQSAQAKLRIFAQEVAKLEPELLRDADVLDKYRGISLPQ